MKKQQVDIPLDGPSEEVADSVCDRVVRYLEAHAESCAEAAAVWARFHYGNAAYVDGTLAVQSVDAESADSGRATMRFDWTFQDGCSDICREGSGYVEFTYTILADTLRLDWVWPEQPSTVDEF